jgi:hypothetical protein
MNFYFSSITYLEVTTELFFLCFVIESSNWFGFPIFVPAVFSEKQEVSFFVVIDIPAFFLVLVPIVYISVFVSGEMPSSKIVHSLLFVGLTENYHFLE